MPKGRFRPARIQKGAESHRPDKRALHAAFASAGMPKEKAEEFYSRALRLVAKQFVDLFGD